jgi:type VI secretion system protein ImpE
MTTFADHFKAGNLPAALDAALAGVKAAPTDRIARLALVEMLLFAGDLERADKHLDMMSTNASPQDMMIVLTLRQLVRAETARREVFAKGRVPEFLAGPTPACKSALEALIRLREGKADEAMPFVEQVENERAKVNFTHNGTAVVDLRDLDDVTAGVLEVMSGTGKYFWVPFEEIVTLKFAAPEWRGDLLFRRAKLVVKSGEDADVFVPALYPNSHTAAEDTFKLGRQTDYTGGDGSPVRGIGLKEYLVGEDVVSVMELGELVFAK